MHARAFVSPMLGSPLVLGGGMTPSEVELIAWRVVELLEERSPTMGVLVGVEDVARYLNVSEAFVYEHRVDLGARKVGSLLRFSLTELDQRLRMAQPGDSDATSCSTSMQSPTGSPAQPRVRRRRRRSTAHTTGAAAQTGEPDQP
jgi:hypothetical protein